MKKEELRIGNYVIIDNRNEIVFEILKDGVMAAESIKEIPKFHKYNELIKVPLNDWWLYEFGFETEDTPNEFVIVLGYDFGEFIINKADWYYLKEGRLDVSCDSVHFLQNLYYFTTGNELEENLSNSI
jgi:hypothetical protein